MTVAKDFDAVDDKVQATITAVDTESWTMGAYFNPDTLGESNVGKVLNVETTGNSPRQYLSLNTSQRIQAQQGRATSASVAISNNDGIVLDVLQVVIATFRVADNLCRLYRGTLSSAIAELSYGSQTAGSGARQTAGTVACIGNRPGQQNTFDGPIARVFFDAREWSVAEMDAFRLGWLPPPSATLRGLWPLDSPVASEALDISGNGAHGTVTGTTVVEGPRFRGARSLVLAGQAPNRAGSF